MSDRGDPLAALGLALRQFVAFRARSEIPVGGVGDYADLLDAYEAESGRRIGLDGVRYWQAVVRSNGR